MVANRRSVSMGCCFIGLLMLVLMPSFYAQAQTVTGNVVDSKTNEVLPGVNVVVKGTNSGGFTNNQGHYAVNVSSLTDTLVFSFVGYKKKEVPVQNRTNVDVQLVPKTYTGKETVVIGYGTQKKEDLTGAVASVSAEDLEDIPSNSLAEALSGRLAGVSFTKNQGGPGAEERVRVRGTASITQGNAPLYIVDGVEVENALSILSPSEIESVTVLKDAASTAVYGARGSNGVLLISTKSGESTPLRVTFSSFAGVRKMVNKLDVLNPSQFVQYQYQLYNINGDPEMAQNFRDRYGRAEDLDIYNSIPTADWQDRVFGRSAFHTTNELTFSGGSDNDSYHITLNHLGEDGIQIGSGFHRNFISFKYDHQSGDKFHFGLNTRYSRQGIDGEGTTNSGSQSANYLRNTIRYKPFLTNGGQNNIDVFSPDYLAQSNLVNPVLLTNNQIEHRNTNNLFLNGRASYDFSKHLTIKTQLGWVSEQTEDNQFDGKVTYEAYKNNQQPIVNLGEGNEVTFSNTNTLNYQQTFNKDHTFNLLLGEETRSTHAQGSDMRIQWLPADITADQAFASIQKANPPPGEVQSKPSTFESETTLLSFFGRLNYSYQSKYLATLTIRRDGSSKFPVQNRYRTFPSAALAWRVTNEDFLSDADWLSTLKLRLSIGTTGNNGIGNDLFKTIYETSSQFNYAFENSVRSGLGPNALANANIQWEKTVSKNIGLDFGFFGDRLRGSIDAYIQDSNNLLLEKEIPSTSGFSEQIQNVGGTRNKGIELQLGGNIIQKENFTWNADLNLATNQNKITSLGKDAAGNTVQAYLIQSGWVNNLQDFRVAVGEPVGQFYGYVTDGYYTVDDFNYDASTQTYTLKDGLPNDSQVALGREPVQPGDIKLKDLTDNNDNTIGPDDRKVLGSAQPLFHGGFRQQFGYKNFDLSIMLDFSYGNEEYNANNIEFTTAYNYTDQNLLASLSNRFKWFDENGNKVNDPEKLKALNSGDNIHWDPPHGQYFLRSSAIEDGSYLRVRNITVGYSLSPSLLKNLKFLSHVRVYATVNNLYTFTSYSGFDPVASTRGNTLRRGVDYASYPRNIYVLGGVNITF